MLQSKDVNSDNCCSCLSAQKTFIASFWHPVCDWRILMFHLAHMPLQIGCWWNGDGRCQWMERLPLKICPSFFSSYTSCSTHSPMTTQHSNTIWSVHCHSKEHPALSKSCSFLSQRCSQHWLEMLSISEQVHLFSGFNVYLVDPEGLLMNTCFPVLFWTSWWCRSLLLKIWSTDKQYQHPLGTH